MNLFACFEISQLKDVTLYPNVHYIQETMLYIQSKLTTLQPQSDLITKQQIIGFWAREVIHQWEDPATFYSSNLKGECGVEDEEEAYKDPAMFDPHLEYESELLKADCFK
uniref:Uncharacterized protein n=1 Tax=Romanomermis culicivorax TaxID=13658 RepID=A0A915KG75_ROMCU